MKVTIAFATQTNSSAEAAATLCVRLRQLKTVTSASVQNLKYVKLLPQLLRLLNSNDIVIFIIPTWGKGDPPKDLMPIWKTLNDWNLDGELISRAKVCMFGLGDSKYPDFNYACLKLHARFIELGIDPEFVPIGLGNAQHDFGYEGEFDPWSDTLMTELDPSYEPPKDSEDDNNRRPMLLEPRYSIESVSSDMSVRNGTAPCDQFVVLSNKRITAPDHFQDVRKLTLMPTRPASFSPTDVISIKPMNTTERVESLISCIVFPKGITADTPIKLNSIAETNSSVPHIYGSIDCDAVTVRQLFTQHFEIEARPTRFALGVLSRYAKAKHRKKLEELSGYSLDGRNLYDEYIRSERRSFVELFEDFGIYFKNLSVELILSLIPLLSERQYSIASSQKFVNESQQQVQLYKSKYKNSFTNATHTKSLDCIQSHWTPVEESMTPFYLIVAKLEYSTVFGRQVKGVASTYLSELLPGDKIIGTIQKSENNAVPQIMDLSRPVIGIGPGTGIAPIHALLSERLCLAKSLNMHPLEDMAFCGVRHKCKDGLLHDEFNIQTDNLIYWAYSRPDDHEDKQYVQDIMAIPDTMKILMKKLIDSNGVIVISGQSAPMPEQVMEVIAKGYDEHEQTDGGGKAFVNSLIATNRLVLDTWA